MGACQGWGWARRKTKSGFCQGGDRGLHLNTYLAGFEGDGVGLQGFLATLELPNLPGSTPLSLMLPIHQGFDPISVAFSNAGPHTLTRPPRTA